MLKSLTPRDYVDFVHAHLPDYAEAKHLAGRWALDDALDRAAGELEGLLSGAFLADGHAFLKVLAQGRLAAWLWIGPSPDEPHRSDLAYLYQITVEPDLRGRGIGTAAILALERRLARAGVAELRLNVFQQNAGARALYERLGFEAVEEDASAARMVKRLGAPRDRLHRPTAQKAP